VTMEPPLTVERFARARRAHWESAARVRSLRRWRGTTYHRRLAELVRFFVPPGKRVLEVGCGRGDLLKASNPSLGVGVDFSSEAVRDAARRHPALRFVQADAHVLPLCSSFDVIILSDLVNDVWDVQRVLEEVARVSAPGARVFLNFYSHIWEWPLGLAERLSMATPKLQQSWLTVEDVGNLLHLAGFELVRSSQEVIWPFHLASGFLNRVLVRFPPFRWLALTNVVVARRITGAALDAEQVTVSVVVPARNEAGMIEEIARRVPKMGGGVEVLFVEGHSTDGTADAIARVVAGQPDGRFRMLQQRGVGKGDAVRLGFSEAKGDVLMILDADLTVAPEDLPRFLDVLLSGKGEFVNGVRLVYPMEGEAMRLFNLAGNKAFSAAFTWVLGQRIKDTLCGTKVLWRRDYEAIAARRAEFGDFDPFGDFDLLFGAARLGLRIVDLPVRYAARTYGTTKISRWRHGVLLLRMLGIAVRRLKFA
jgi:SAM-dependent methyltransferase